MNKRSPPVPPAPPGWNKTIQDLFAETRSGKSHSVGSPEVDWARDYERSLIPIGSRFPKKGDVYEATTDVEVSYLTSWAAPCTGGGKGTLMKGERVVIDADPLPRAIIANGRPIDYLRVEERVVPFTDRTNGQYSGFYLLLKTIDLSRYFKLVHEEASKADYQESAGPST
jgi:hypothetical protein